MKTFVIIYSIGLVLSMAIMLFIVANVTRKSKVLELADVLMCLFITLSSWLFILTYLSSLLPNVTIYRVKGKAKKEEEMEDSKDE